MGAVNHQAACQRINKELERMRIERRYQSKWQPCEQKGSVIEHFGRNTRPLQDYWKDMT